MAAPAHHLREDPRTELKRFSRRLALGLGGFVVLGAVLGQRQQAKNRELANNRFTDESATAGCGKSRIDIAGPIAWYTDYEIVSAKSMAEGGGKMILVFVGAEWDTGTKEFEDTSFRDPDIRNILHEKYIALYIDSTETEDEPPILRKMLDRFNIIGLPSLLLFTAGFKHELVRVNQYIQPQRVLSILLSAPDVKEI
jgi:thiol:disulfide interchange protein